MTSVASSPIQRIAEPFAIPGFRSLWLGAVLFALGTWTERVAVGWYVFDQTDSAFLTAVATAAHAAPGLIAGPIAGAVSDRSARPRVLAGAAALKVAALVGIALLVRDAEASLPLIVMLVAVSGVGMSFHFSSLHTLSGDLVGAERRARAISIVSVGQRAVSAVGAVSSGAVIAAFGASWSFAIAAVALTFAGLAYRSIREPTERAGRSSTSFVFDTLEGLRVVGRVRLAALLLGLMVVVEIFGFAYIALLPAVAARVLEIGETRYGILSGAPPIGGVLGMLFLAACADRLRLGIVFVGVFASFGVLMGLLGSSPWFAVSLLVAAGIGARAAMVDALEWIMLQAAVSDEHRGRALGAWNVAIGFGWIGPLVLGALADAVTVTAAFALAGGILVATAALAGLLSPRLRAV